MHIKVNLIRILPILCGLLMGCQDSQQKTIKIGIIEPLEHAAMHDIVEGFRSSLQNEYGKPVTIRVENAQNDMNLQHAIIQKMKDAHYDVIIPIGTTASQMAVGMISAQPIVSLASNLSNEERAILKNCHLAIVHDEISPRQTLNFVKKAYPEMKNIMLIHSSAEKVLPDVDAAIKAGDAVHIKVHHRMVTSLSELYTVVQSLSNDYDGILVLKDHLIVSGISTLSKVAEKKNIPLIASDEGSLGAGADIAIGVREKQIGVEGGKLVAEILKGKAACQLPIVEMTSLSVFVNPLHKTVQSHFNDIQKAAALSNYPIIRMNER